MIGNVLSGGVREGGCWRWWRGVDGVLVWVEGRGLCVGESGRNEG